MQIEPNMRGALGGSSSRTPVVLVAGLDPAAVGRAADALVLAGTTLVHHDLSAVSSGRVVRTVRSVDLDGNEVEQLTEVNLEHGCVSCTLRLDLLPLLRRLHRRDSVETVVVQLDSLMEPEAVSWAIQHAVVADMPGFVDGPAGLDVAIAATLVCVAEMDWLEQATGDRTVGEVGLGAFDDERTVAQVAVGQVGFADALVVAGADPAATDRWESARLMAVLRRLAPLAPIVMELPQRPLRPLIAMQLMRSIPADARRGRLDGPHDPLLRGRPPLTPECGVSLVEFHSDRPFHPDRLHEALDVVLEGVVCARGRLWLANRPDEAFWVESAGEALQVAVGGRWVAAMTADEYAALDPERQAMAALRWDESHGDRHTSIVVLAHRADPDVIIAAFRSACLDDAEMADGQGLWMAYADPFGLHHTDPCAETAELDRAELFDLFPPSVTENPDSNTLNRNFPNRNFPNRADPNSED